MDTGASENVLTGVASVTIRGESITVKELTWRQYFHVATEAVNPILKLIGEGQKKGGVEITTERVIETIRAEEGVITKIVSESTGKDKAWIEGLNGREMMMLLNTVLELNLSPEVISLGKTIAGRMGDAFGLKMPLQKPSIS